MRLRRPHQCRGLKIDFIGSKDPAEACEEGSGVVFVIFKDGVGSSEKARLQWEREMKRGVSGRLL